MYTFNENIFWLDLERNIILKCIYWDEIFCKQVGTLVEFSGKAGCINFIWRREGRSNGKKIRMLSIVFNSKSSFPPWPKEWGVGLWYERSLVQIPVRTNGTYHFCGTFWCSKREGNGCFASRIPLECENFQKLKF